MQFFRGVIRPIQRHAYSSSRNVPLNPLGGVAGLSSLEKIEVKAQETIGSQVETRRLLKNMLPDSSYRASMPFSMSIRCMATTAGSAAEGSLASDLNVVNRIKFKRLDKTAQHIMQIIDKEAVEEVKGQREIPDIRPGYIVQLKVEVPENKRRVQVLKGIVIARRNAGLNTTFRIRRLVAGVGVESLFPLYSPNIKEIKVLDKKKVRRAKLYYLRDKMNALKKQ